MHCSRDSFHFLPPQELHLVDQKDDTGVMVLSRFSKLGEQLREIAFKVPGRSTHSVRIE
jgi:hypothetical protein